MLTAKALRNRFIVIIHPLPELLGLGSNLANIESYNTRKGNKNKKTKSEIFLTGRECDSSNCQQQVLEKWNEDLPGGRDCFNFSTLVGSLTQRVYR